MKNYEFAGILRQRGASITADDLYCVLEELIGQGLRVLTVCNDGSGRSRNAASDLNNIGIPAVRLKGGIKQFYDGRQNRCILYAQGAMNLVPRLAVILTAREMLDYSNFLNGLRALRYTDSRMVVGSIEKLEGNTI